MLTYPTGQAGRCRIFSLGALGVLAAVFALAPAANLRADVDADGDVTPSVENPFPPGPPVPDLPIDGGEVDGDVIVGGTGQGGVVAPVGQVVIDNPGTTAPLVSENLYIAGAPNEPNGGSGTPEISGDSLGRVVVSDLFSEWRIAEQLSVGGFGQGFLEITAGGLVTTGDPLAATNEIDDAFVGQGEASQGYVLVTGFGSTLNNNFLTVGFFGAGRVDVAARGTLRSRRTAVVGDQVELEDSNRFIGTGTVTVDGIGTRWTIGDNDLDSDTGGTPEDLIVGNEGRGTVEVRNHGLVRVENDTRVGLQPGSYGEILVNGRDSLFWTFNDLTVGESALAQAEMHIENEGSVRADVSTTIGPTAIVDLATGGELMTPLLTNNGVIRGDGRIEAGASGVPIINNGYIRNGAGIANLRERMEITGPVDNFQNIESVGGEIEFEQTVNNVGPGGDIVGIDAILRFNGGLVNSADLFLKNTLIWTMEPAAIANSANLVVLPGESHLDGNLALMSTGTFSVEVGHTSSLFSIDGTALVDGNLFVGAIDDILGEGAGDGYVPSIGDTFEILTADSVFGQFDVILDGFSGIAFNAIYESNRVLLSVGVGAIFDPDLNDDGNVDGGDFLVWQQFYGSGLNGEPPVTPGSNGDGNGDGVVNDLDFEIWKDGFGEPPAVAAAGAVPEPGAAVLAVAAALALPLARRRR